MKYLLLCTSLFVFAHIVSAQVTTSAKYKCVDYSWIADTLFLQIDETQGELKYVVNGKDTASLSNNLPNARPQNGYWKELDGDFPSVDASNVKLIVDAYLSNSDLIQDYPYGVLEMHWTEGEKKQFTRMKCDKY